MANIMDHKTKYLIAKWAKRINMVERAKGEAMSYEKRAALANSLENTHQRILACEATNPGSIGQYKRYALDLITAVVPNLIAFDIYAVQPMDNRIGMLNYLDYSYSKAKGATPAGHTFASSINMGKSDPYYTSDLVKDEPIAKAGETTVDVVLPWNPVRVSTFSLQCGEDTAIADATGVISGTGVFDKSSGFAGTITPAGVLKITAFHGTTTSDVTATYRYNNEDIRSDGPDAAGFTNIPEIELSLKSLPIEAQARAMRAFWSFDAAYELTKEYGQDIETLLATQSTGELAHEIDNELTLDLVAFANADAPLVWSRSPQQPGIALVDHYDSFMVKLNEGANKIFNATRKVKANFVIGGIDVSTVLESMRGFTPSGVSAVGPHFIGTLGNYKCFVNPDYKANEFVLGYKGSTMFDAGAFYCPYMPVSSTDLIMDANFRGQRGYATMYGKKLLNDKMYIKGYITD